MKRTVFNPKDISFSHVADMYLSELRKGKAIPMGKLAEALPHLAEKIRAELPALVLLERTMGPTNPSKEIDVDEEVGGCELVREVGRGAVGVVFEAYDRGLDRKVAVKVIPLVSNGLPIAIDRFELERRAMARLEHPHIVPVYSSGVNDYSAFLVMKLITGSSLYALQNGSGDFKTRYYFSTLRSNWHSLATLGVNVASGLQHAHQQGLVHRDIKPGNLLMDNDGKIWITDFGLAKVFDNTSPLSRTGDAIGTPRYMAPEQICGICDARSDVYSLGITLYELAIGKSVWGEKSCVSILTSRHSIELPSLNTACADIPEELSKIIMKACQFSPENRYQTAGELHSVLQRFVDGKSNADRRHGKRLSNDLYRKKSRRDTIIACSIAMIASFCIGMYTFLSRSQDNDANASRVAPGLSVNGSAVRLIDRLADRDQNDMVEIVTDFVSHSIIESDTELQLSGPAKEEIRNQVDTIATQIKTTGLTEESLGKFLNGYRKTSLPVATKVMRLVAKVEASGMGIPEKNVGIKTVQALATAAINGYISERDVDAIMSDLIGFQPKSTSEVVEAVVPDVRLRAWLLDLKGYLSNLPAAAFVYQESKGNPLNDMKEVFEHAFGENDLHRGKQIGGTRGLR